MNHKQLVQQMADMKADLDRYQSELTNLRNQVTSYEDVETPIANTNPTSRRKMLKRMAIAGIGGIGAIGLAAAAGPNYTVLAAAAPGDNAIEAVGGPNGYGLSASGGMAQLMLLPGSTLPATTNHSTGELYVDNQGDLYYMSGTTTNTNLAWRRISGTNTAGAFAALPAITRIVFTDTGTTLNPGTGQIPGYGSTPNDSAVNANKRTFQATSNSAGQVPPGATAIFATFTTYGYPGIGYLTAWKTGTTFPRATPTIPLVTVSNVPGVTFSNSTAVVPLSSAGQFDAACRTNVSLVVDVQGYFL